MRHFKSQVVLNKLKYLNGCGVAGSKSDFCLNPTPCKSVPCKNIVQTILQTAHSSSMPAIR